MIFAIFINCTVPKKFIEYTELNNHVGAERFSRILIISTGQSGTNLFLEELSERLNKRLASKNIQTFYFHLGNNPVEANKQFNLLNQDNNYDAILRVAQLDSSRNPIIITTGGGSLPTRNGMMSYQYFSRDIRYEQKFSIKYFDSKDLSNSLANISLGVRIDFLNPRDYSKLVDKLINSLKLN